MANGIDDIDPFNVDTPTVEEVSILGDGDAVQDDIEAYHAFKENNTAAGQSPQQPVVQPDVTTQTPLQSTFSDYDPNDPVGFSGSPVQPVPSTPNVAPSPQPVPESTSQPIPASEPQPTVPQPNQPQPNQPQPTSNTGNPPPAGNPPAKTNSTIEWIKNNPGTSLGLVALLGITGYLLYKRRKKKQKEAEEMAKESSFYLNPQPNGLYKLASGEADKASKGSIWDSFANMAERAVQTGILNGYNNFVKENPYVIPGTIAAGTGLLSTAASGKSSTGLTTALGAIGGWAGGNYLYNNYSKDIEGWVGRNLGEKAVPFTQAATPVVGALAGSLLGAALGN